MYQLESRKIYACGLAFIEYAPIPKTVLHQCQVALLLHGWMGTAADLLPLARHLAATGCKVLTPDLPFHGESVDVRPRGMPHAARTMFEALHVIFPKREMSYSIAIIGYSLGGRLAFEMILHADNVLGSHFIVSALILISAAPPPTPAIQQERETIASTSQRLAQHLRDVGCEKAAFRLWLTTTWYVKPMWGSIAHSPGFEPMLRRRVDSLDQRRLLAWSDAAVHLSRATMTEPSRKLHVPVMYICGMQDVKYVMMSETASPLFSKFQHVQICDAGHNVYLQQPTMTESHIVNFLEQTYRESSDELRVDICSVTIMPYSLPLRQAIAVNGVVISRRDGIILVLQSSGRSFGVADICPLPGMHQETVADCREELLQFAHELQRHQKWVMFSKLVDLESEFVGFSQTTKNAIATAAIHLFSNFAGVELVECVYQLSGFRENRLAEPIPEVFLNGVLPRVVGRKSKAAGGERNRFREYVAKSGFDTLKLKVGGAENVPCDALMARDAISAASDMCKKIRFDANRAWNIEKYAQFNELLGSDIENVEYIEEPLSSARELSHYMKTASRSPEEGTLPLALDESLTGGLTELVREMASSHLCRAFIIKPNAIGSWSRIIDLIDLALDRDCEIVLSTCFDSGVGTAWTAILASVFGKESTRHGLGTYKYLVNDVTETSFGEYCVQEGETPSVSIAKCQEFLGIVGRYIAANGETLHL